MRGLAFYCYLSAAIYALLGMALGIFMAASHDHGLSAVHAHLNLLGWASFALYGLFYQAVPAAAATRIARIHVATATLGVWLIIPGIALAVLETTEGLAAIGSFVTILAMALFAFIVVRTRGWNAVAD